MHGLKRLDLGPTPLLRFHCHATEHKFPGNCIQHTADLPPPFTETDRIDRSYSILTALISSCQSGVVWMRGRPTNLGTSSTWRSHCNRLAAYWCRCLRPLWNRLCCVSHWWIATTKLVMLWCWRLKLWAVSATLSNTHSWEKKPPYVGWVCEIRLVEDGFRSSG